MFFRFSRTGKRSLESLSEQEILALAISSEEDDGRIYLAYADALREAYPHSARVFEEMAAEESHHRQLLIDRHIARFGERIPLVRREYVRDFPERKPDWLIRNMPLEKIRAQAEAMEAAAHRFYLEAAARTQDAATRKLLGDLALAEKSHESLARRLGEKHTPQDVKAEEDETARRQFVLTYVQPGLAGLMDGSVSTLAPLFAAAFATHQTWETFLVGLAASVGAGISMGFAEALSDDGSLTGRGTPWLRGAVCGLMTTVGGLGHTLPYLIPDFYIATIISFVVVIAELWAISWIRTKFMDTPFLQAAFQVVVGGVLVFLAGILIGSS